MSVLVRRIGVIVGAALVLALPLVSPVQAAASIVVDALDDTVTTDGNCTLREAIIAANTDAASDACAAGSGADTITFAATGTIDLTTSRQLPVVSDTLTIDGAGQAVSIENGLPPVGLNDGGAIRNTATLTLRNLQFAENRASRGGAVANSGTLTVERVVFYHNGNSSQGGAIYNTGALTVRDTAFNVNYTGPATFGASGGAIYSLTGSLSVERSTFYANISAATGGAIWNFGPASVTNSTFNQNGFQANFGGAIHNRGGAMTVTSSTFSGNSAAFGAAVDNSSANDASMTVANSIFVDSSGGVDCSDLVTDGGYNVSEDGSCVSESTSLTGDPGLSALADNGGATQTQAIGPGSIAFDAIPPGSNGCGSTLVEDQRGTFRPIGEGCEIGAYEYGDVAAPTSTIEVTPDAPDGLADWYVAPVLVKVTGSDNSGGSGLLDVRCAVNPVSVPSSYSDLPACDYTGAGLSVSTNGLVTVYAAAKDNAGNEEAVHSISFNVDTVAPALTCDMELATFELGDLGDVFATVSDATSGPASTTASGTADTSSVGSREVTVYGADAAGNAGQTDCAYRVGYNFLGFSSPSSRPTRPGSTINVTFALGGADGLPIPDGDAAALANACAAQVSLDGDDPTARCATYDARKDRFTYAIELSPSISLGTHVVTVHVLDGEVVLNTESRTFRVSLQGRV